MARFLNVSETVFRWKFLQKRKMEDNISEVAEETPVEYSLRHAVSMSAEVFSDFKHKNLGQIP